MKRVGSLGFGTKYRDGASGWRIGLKAKLKV